MEVSGGQFPGAGVADNVELRYVRPDHYIAVSCPWEIPSPDDAKTKRYQINPDAGMRKIIMPQEAVLDRVVNQYSLSYVWG